LRKTPMIVLGLTASLALAGGTAAVAQDTTPAHTLDMGISPSKAGTKKKPKTVKVKLDISNNVGAGTTASVIEIFFPKTIKLNTKGFKTCSITTLETGGPTACAKGSKIGAGTAGALVNPTSAAPTKLEFANSFYVGSSKQLNIYLKQTNGDQAVTGFFAGKIGRAGGKFGAKLTIAIPENLQQPIPGLYSALTDIKTSLSGTAGKGRKKHGIFQSTGCSSRAYAFQSRLTYVNNPNPPAATTSTDTDSVPCKK
jgi:hypothetical protein